MATYTSGEPVTLLDDKERAVAYGVVEEAEPGPAWFSKYGSDVIPSSWRVPSMWLEIVIKSVVAAKRAQNYQFPLHWIFDSEHNVDLDEDDLTPSELLKLSNDDGMKFIVYHPQLIKTRYRKQPANR